MGPAHANRITLLFLFAASLGAPGAVGQTVVDTLPRGQIVERRVSLTDTTQHYAVYVPSSYDTTRAWPVLFAMDPRGRALIPMRLFREAAERLGYIVLSSYNTASDVVGESPNETALSAMLEDAQRLFVIHPKRLYLAGFSGTARISWVFARQLSDPPSASEVADELEIERLKRTAREQRGTYEGDAARRILASIFVSTSFYDPRTYFDAEEWDRARVVLELAHRIHPEHQRVCFDLARAYARLGAPDRAMQNLTCAADAEQIDAQAILGHPDLQSLRSRDDFEALLDRLRG